MKTTPGCHDPEVLAAYRNKPPYTPEREAIEAHAAVCGACRRALLLLDIDETELPVTSPEVLQRLHALKIKASPALRPWRSSRVAAAAAVLLALPLTWALLRRETDHSAGNEGRQAPSALPAEVPRGFPAGLLGSRGIPQAHLGAGVELVIQTGGEVEVGGSRCLRPRAGRFWVEVSRGEPVTIALAGGLLELRQGVLVVDLPSARAAAWLLGEAHAEEPPPATVWILRGEAEFKGEGQPAILKAGQKLLLTPGGRRQEAFPAGEASSLQEERLLAVAASGGQAVMSPGVRLSAGAAGADPGILPASTPWRWVTVLSGRQPQAELGLSFAVAGSWYEWVPALAAASSRPREVVEILWDGERLTGRVNGASSFSADLQRLKAVLRPADREAWGIAVWGGAVTVDRSMLQGQGGSR